ncbi:MAG TPA: metallophosphoesterase family protein [Gammaproteobacteria bacterium]
MTAGTENIIGVISDTHGLLRPEALHALRGASLILHAGDIGKPDVLSGLEALAPVIAVRGNNDNDDWANAIPECEIVTVDDVQIYLLHDLKDMRIDPVRAGHRVVITGHSHSPAIDERDGVLYLNPGSAGPRRFRLPVSVARLQVRGSVPAAEIIELDIARGIE